MANTLKFGNGIWATQEGSTLAYNDENGNYKPLPFEFERDTNATVVNKNGLIETVGNNIPRIDFQGNNKGALLLEPQRTNLVTYSSEFDNAAWVKQEITISQNVGISPDGTLNADKIIPSAVSATHQIYALSLISSQVCATSVFAKADGINTFEILDGAIGTNGVAFDLLNGTFTNKGSGIGSMEYYGNGWYRCISVATTTGYRIYCPSSSVTASGDGTSGVYLWGAQLEVGSYATSYIPTNGSTVTRVAETCNDAGDASTFNDSEGVLMVEISALSETSRISLNDGTTSNNVRFSYDAGANRIDGIVFNGNNQFLGQYTLPTQGSFNKISLKYKPSDFSLWVNGFKVGSLVGSGTTFTEGTLSELDFDAGGNGVIPFYGKTSQIQYFDTTLTDAELETLTSWQSFSEMANGQNYTII